MKTKDRLKEEIGLSKLLVTILSAVSISLITWIWNNHNILTKYEVLLFSLAVILLILSLFVTYLSTAFKINNLDKYE